MLYSMFFYNATTEEIVCKMHYGHTAHRALYNFRRWLRRLDLLKSGDAYKIVQYEADKRNIHDYPEELFTEIKEIAR